VIRKGNTHDLPLDHHITNGDVEIRARDRERQRHAPVEALGQFGDERAVENVDLDLLRAVDSRA
jgi:hypothetical protein